MSVFEVFRDDDGELLGFVEDTGSGRWRALAVFGGELGSGPDRDAAQDMVEAAGLAALAEPWWYDDGGTWVPAVIREAGPARVTAMVGAMPDVPVAITLTGPDAARLRRARPH